MNKSNVKDFSHTRVVLFCVFIIALIVSSCQKSPINGNLDGQWQVLSVEPAPTNIVTEERLYYCFSLHTVQLTIYGMGPMLAGNILKFDKDTLILEFPYAHSNESDISLLEQYGIRSNPVCFTIKLLNKKQMVLQNGDTTITLRKF